MLTLTVTIIKLCSKPAKPQGSCPQGAPQALRRLLGPQEGIWPEAKTSPRAGMS